MPWVGGHLFDGNGAIEGAVELDPHGVVKRVETSLRGLTLARRALVTPAPVNAHTHVGDRALRGKVKPTTIEKVFAPPGGAKHRLLRDTPPEEVVKGMRHAFAEARLAGVVRIMDFREGGPAGARMLRGAASSSQLDVTVLGRPSEPSAWENERDELLELVDGLGLSALADQPSSITEEQATWCHEHGRTLALHWSEACREDVDGLVSLGPDLVVHATFATRRDLEALADAGARVVVCPRSNALFGNRPPVGDMLDAGLVVGLGTDNAMFQDLDVWAEARHVVEHLGVEPLDAVRMTCGFSLASEPAPALAPGTRVALLPEPRDGHVQMLSS